MKGLTIFAAVLAIIFWTVASSQATLVDMNDGTIYDTDTQLSWLKDTQAGGVFQTFAGANAWLATLNTGGGFAGYTNWRLPTADPTCTDVLPVWHCINSEMGHLYYTELGNIGGIPASNTGPFTNMTAGNRWTGTDYAPDPTQAWGFDLGGGSQWHWAKGSISIAWAVRDGVRAVCGDGIAEPGEQCDDGNTNNGDGCSSTCQTEALPQATPVGYTLHWLIVTFLSLMLVGGFLLRRKRR